MPEGHTIHRLARDLSGLLLNKRIRASSPQGRFEADAEAIDTSTLEAIEPVGKHLFFRFGRDAFVHVHLGLYGKFRQFKGTPPDPLGQVRWRLHCADGGFDLNGPAACELVDVAGRDAIFARLGEDPLRDDGDAESLWARVGRSRAAIGAMLLDQSKFAGVGNIFRAEALLLTGIHPERAGRDLTRDEFDALWQTLTDLMRIGVKYNRIITADPATVGRSRTRMRREERLLIYKKDRCGSCGGPVTHFEQASRAMFACRRCQR